MDIKLRKIQKKHEEEIRNIITNDAFSTALKQYYNNLIKIHNNCDQVSRLMSSHIYEYIEIQLERNCPDARISQTMAVLPVITTIVSCAFVYFSPSPLSCVTATASIGLVFAILVKRKIKRITNNFNHFHHARQKFLVKNISILACLSFVSIILLSKEVTNRWICHYPSISCVFAAMSTTFITAVVITRFYTPLKRVFDLRTYLELLR